MLEAVTCQAQPVTGERLHFEQVRLRQDITVTFRRIFSANPAHCPVKVQIFPIAFSSGNRLGNISCKTGCTWLHPMASKANLGAANAT
jgi:hypothetical protein